MAFNANIPQSTDEPSQSQMDLLNNFTAINNFVNVNHVAFNGPNQGKHFTVTLPNQSVAPVTGGADIDIYNKLNAISGAQALNIQTAGGVIPLITGINATQAYSYTATGLLLKYGSGTVTGDQLFTEANAPYYNNVYAMLVTPYKLVYAPATDPNLAVTINGPITVTPATSVTVRLYGCNRITGAAVAVPYYYIILGN